METAPLRIRMEATTDRNSNRRPNRIGFWQVTRAFAGFVLIPAINSQLHADIPWPEVAQRLAYENDKLGRRPQGHNGEYFVVCTLYYTPKESGFTFERGFDATPVTKPGLHGRKYPRDFLRSVKKEGFGRITTPVSCRKPSGATAGRSWTPAEGSGDGRSIVISAKMNRWGPASSRLVRVRPPLSTHTPTPEW